MQGRQRQPDPFAPGLLARLPFTVRKVALLRASRIGDFICATPALRALRRALPEAEIVMISLPILRDMIERLPYVDRFVAFPGFPGLAEQFFEARKTAAFFLAMQAEAFDLAVQMQGSGVYTNPFTLMLGARATAAFVRPGDGAGCLDAALPLPETGHEVRRVLGLTEFIGAASQGEATHFGVWAEDHAAAELLLAQAAPPLIGLHPGAWDVTRRWAPDRFAAVGRRLRERHGGTVVVLGGPEQHAQAETVRQLTGDACLNLAGHISLGVLGAVVTRLGVLITNDSGPAHVAYALQRPTVTIFGSADPDRYGPPCHGPYRALVQPVACRPCGYATCPIGYPCLNSITVDQVSQAAEEVLRHT